MRKFIRWIFSPSTKPIVEELDVYSKLIELEEKYNGLLLDIKRLEEENIETTNAIYEIANSIEARIDILASEPYTYKNFTDEQ